MVGDHVAKTTQQLNWVTLSVRLIGSSQRRRNSTTFKNSKFFFAKHLESMSPVLLIKSIDSKEEEDPVQSHPTPGYGKSMDSDTAEH